jgi:hypothetical protein
MAAQNYLTTDSLDLLPFTLGHSAWAASAWRIVLSLLQSGAHLAVFMILVLGRVQPVVCSNVWHDEVWVRLCPLCPSHHEYHNDIFLDCVLILK